MITILNYQAGNLKSLCNALTRQGFQSEITDNHAKILDADLVILPGVGSFGDAAEALKRQSLNTILKQRHQNGKPILGICLGMQLLYDDSSESSGSSFAKGLGLLRGNIRYLSPGNSSLKVPHMGWNQLKLSAAPRYFQLPFKLSAYEDSHVYFVHSYGLSNIHNEEVLFYADHGAQIPALVYKEKTIHTGALMGFQFHPEKSGVQGERLLADVIRILL